MDDKPTQLKLVVCGDGEACAGVSTVALVAVVWLSTSLALPACAAASCWPQVLSARPACLQPTFEVRPATTALRVQRAGIAFLCTQFGPIAVAGRRVGGGGAGGAACC
jgi:hypothetical protein